MISSMPSRAFCSYCLRPRIIAAYCGNQRCRAIGDDVADARMRDQHAVIAGQRRRPKLAPDAQVDRDGAIRKPDHLAAKLPSGHALARLQVGKDFVIGHQPVIGRVVSRRLPIDAQRLVGQGGERAGCPFDRVARFGVPGGMPGTSTTAISHEDCVDASCELASSYTSLDQGHDEVIGQIRSLGIVQQIPYPRLYLAQCPAHGAPALPFALSRSALIWLTVFHSSAVRRSISTAP